MAWVDKEKQRKYQKEYYPSLYFSQHSEYILFQYLHQDKMKTWFKEYKNTIKCLRCTESNPCCIDFHHTGNDKKFNVSNMANSGYSIKKMKEEISKCIPLCANCHRKETENKRASSSA